LSLKNQPIQSTMGMFHYYDFKESEVFIFDNFLVNQVKEGVTVIPVHNDKLRKVIDKHFGTKKWSTSQTESLTTP